MNHRTSPASRSSAARFSRALLSLLLVFAQVPRATAQQPAAPPPPTPQQTATPVDAADDDIVQITTNLVQVDATVTDRDGRQVTDLRAEDFEIFENGERRSITNFSYITLAPEPAATPAPSRADSVAAAPPPPVRLRPEQIRRTIALVVDDLGLSFESTHFVRQALRKYVDQQMGANDFVAIIRTSAGAGALQQFTSDKRQLYAAIERVRWFPSGRGGIGAFSPIDSFDERARDARNENQDAISRLNSDREDLDDFREEIFAVGTLGALNFVVRGLRELPGRKAVVLFSDGISLVNRVSSENGGGADFGTRVVDSMRRLTDLANRASVVVYTLDARGLQTTGLTAADNTSGMSLGRIQQLLSDRRAELFDTQDGLNYLAQETGGIAVRNSNDLSGGIRRALEDQRGYYLIGYRPDEKTFDPVTGQRRYNKLTIKLKNRNGLRIRTRSGFYGVASEDVRPTLRTRSEQMMAALTSPFATGGVPLRLTSIFGNDVKEGSFARSMLHIDAREFSFKEEPDGWHKAVMDIIAVTYGDGGRVVDSLNRTETIRVRGKTFERVRGEGLVYTLNVPVKKPGAYQLRVAVRDATTERTGSASQFIEVPNLAKDRLALSGMVIQSEAPRAANRRQPAPGKNAAPNSDAAPDEDEPARSESEISPVVRHFRPGVIVSYGYQIYNAKLDRATARPQLETQLRLFRDGQQLFAGKPLPFDATGQVDPKRLNAGGGLQLGSEMIAGEYILQVVVTDLLAKGKRRTTTQFIDFEIVKQ